MSKEKTEKQGPVFIAEKTEYKDVKMPIGQITVDHAWNTRKQASYTGADFDVKQALDVSPTNALASAKAAQSIEELAKLIKKDGLMNRPIARDCGDGLYKLVAGFRRFEAMKMLGWTEIPIRLKQMTDSEAIRINLEENQARKDLTSPELAEGAFRYAKALEAEGVQRSGGRKEGTEKEKAEGMHGYGSRIAAEMSISKSAVNLYLRIMDNVAPEIIKVWQDAANPSQKLCTLGRLDTWSKMPKADQIMRFRNLEKTGAETVELSEETAAGTDVIETGAGAGGSGPMKDTPILRMIKYDHAAEALNFFKDEIRTTENAQTRQWMQGAIRALEWCMGKVKKERKGKEVIGDLGAYDPWATTEEAADDDKREQAAQAAATPTTGVHVGANASAPKA